MSEPKKDSKPEETSSKPGKAEAPPPNIAEPSNKTGLDYILKNEIGNFGSYQRQNYIVSIILILFISLAECNFVFTTAYIPTRCKIKECESKPPVFKPPWVMNAIPPDPDKAGFDDCLRYAPAGGTAAPPKPGTCPAELFNRKKTLPCESYVHENTFSVVYDFGLECDEWKRTYLGMFRKMGTLTALPLTGYISDRWGRRIAICFNAINGACLGVIRYWVKDYWTFLALEFTEANFGSGLFSSVYILVVEMLSCEYRVPAGISINSTFAVGQMLLGIIAWKVPHWRKLSLAVYIPQFSSILVYWLIGQSVRWLLSKGRLDDAEAVLKRMANRNGTTVKESSLAGLRRGVQEQLTRELQTNRATDVDEPSILAQVWRHKRVLIRVIITPIWWLSTIFIYYGLGVNSIIITGSGNKYLNFIAVAAADLPGYFLSLTLLTRIGRKPVLAAGFWICGICQFAYIFLPDDLTRVLLMMYLVGKCMIAMVMSSIYVYTSELYPTKARHQLLAFSSMIGRLGAVIAPLTPAFAEQWFPDMPFVLFGSMAVLSGVLITFVPETLGIVLPNTFQEAEDIGLKPRTDT